jgi:peptidoglycan/xylan/chitin deacetylase (PgdA/CDA1 family)
MNPSSLKRVVKESFAWVKLDDRFTNTILLTFDDGPHPESTPAVLRLLREYNARAIFFVVGARIERAPHLLKRILDEGHALGNHSYSHPLGRQPWLGPYLKDLLKCQRSVEELTGERPKFYRPPLGKFSLTGIVAPKVLGLTTMLWSVDANDWGLKSGAAARSAADRLAERLAANPSRNDIVLMHDDHPYIAPILERVLPQLARQNRDLSSALDVINRPSSA